MAHLDRIEVCFIFNQVVAYTKAGKRKGHSLIDMAAPGVLHRRIIHNNGGKHGV